MAARGVAGRFGAPGVSVERWVFALVALAYVPDVGSQLGLLAGQPAARIAAHSVWFGALAAAVLAYPVSRFLRVRLRLASAVALASIAVHDFMDLLQSSDRSPFWPVATRAVDWSGWIPSSLRGELLLFGPMAAVAVWLLSRQLRWRRHSRAWTWLVAVAAIVGAAGTMSVLRAARERQLVRARALAESGQYSAALDVCRLASRWPSIGRPGRVDYVRAVAWTGLGDRARAEQFYRLSYAEDPTYIWTVADLAYLAASGTGPDVVRRQRAEPWLMLLRTEFSAHPAADRLAAKAERYLHAP